MASRKPWNKKKIIAILAEDSQRGRRAVERGLVLIYSRQTQDERRIKDTKHSNGAGFSAAHARKGSRLAQWILKNYSKENPVFHPLTGRFIAEGRELIIHYASQLADIANAKEARRAMQTQTAA